MNPKDQSAQTPIPPQPSQGISLTPIQDSSSPFAGLTPPLPATPPALPTAPTPPTPLPPAETAKTETTTPPPTKTIPQIDTTPQPVSTTWIVHAMRIAIKLVMIGALVISQNAYILPLGAYIIISELLDQATIYLLKKRPGLKNFVASFYSLNSVAVISINIFLGNWALSDYYLIYIVHISSATLTYGVKWGISSYILSTLSYGSLLFTSNAPLIYYLRLPLLSILALRLFVTQGRYEQTDSILSNVLNIEKAKQDFITIASHNLRSPVAAIYGYIELLLRGDAGQLNDKETEYVKRIKGNNQELEKLTEELLQISILEIGKGVTLLRQPSQIEILIQDVVDNMGPAAKTKGLELSFQKDDGILPAVNIDPDRIRSVLLNLIDNAIKYTEKGYITVTAKKEGDFVVVAVKDTGIGIPKADLPKIFTKFFRSGNLLVYNQTGTGLGLYLGKQIVELHGGTMQVDSVEGVGSTFVFTLPVVQEQILE